MTQGWSSILPAQLSNYEVWAVRVFLFLGLMCIGPWIALIGYDLVLYIIRTATYELPVVGGRARGKGKPRAPSLSERPDGRPRRLSLAARVVDATSRPVSPATGVEQRRTTSKGTHRRRVSFQEE